MSNKRSVTRRDFLRLSAGAASLTVLPGLRPGEVQASDRRSRVVLIRNENATGAGGEINGPVVQQMLDDAVVRLLEAEDADSAWKQLLSADDILGIKTNVWRNLPTPSALENRLRDRAMQLGIKESNISIRDRGLLNDAIFTRATALINIRPLRTHHWAGIGGCLKNYITFHPRPWDWHADSCADLGGLWKMPVCAGKTRLNVLVVLTPLFYGIGPHHFDPRHVWAYNGLIVSRDPVAADSVGVRLLEEKRQRFFERPPRGGTSSKHVRYAEERHNIGIANPDAIELIHMGWEKDRLI